MYFSFSFSGFVVLGVCRVAAASGRSLETRASVLYSFICFRVSLSAGFEDWLRSADCHGC